MVKLFTKKIIKNFGLGYKNLIDWNKILDKKNRNILNNLIKKNKDGKKILIATSTGGHFPSLHFDSILAVALIKNGCNVEFLLCNSTLEACQQSTTHLIKEKSFAKLGPKILCASCYESGRLVLDPLGLKIHNLGDYIEKLNIDKIDFQLNKLNYNDLLNYADVDFNLTEDALAGALRFYAVGDLKNENYKEVILRRYIKSAIMTKIAFNNLSKNNNFYSVVLNHGIYVPQGIINKAAKKNKINVVCYQPAYKTGCFTLSHDDTYHHTMMHEPTASWENIYLTEKLDKKITDYLHSRRFGKNDWEYYFRKPDFNIDKRIDKYGLDKKKPIIGLLTNIIWDALLTYPNNIFKDMLEWLFETIDYFEKRVDLQLVIRVHPAEVNSDRVSKQKVLDEINKRYKKLPKNIVVINSDDNLSTYMFTDICNAIIIYATKMGMEFSPFGTPVICAGESYIKNKSITFDPLDKIDYFKILDSLPFKNKLSAETVLRAKKYAYHFFFRRAIPVTSIEHIPHNWPPFIINKNGFERLINGEDKGMEQICKSIINIEPFIYKDEQY